MPPLQQASHALPQPLQGQEKTVPVQPSPQQQGLLQQRGRWWHPRPVTVSGLCELRLAGYSGGVWVLLSAPGFLILILHLSQPRAAHWVFTKCPFCFLSTRVPFCFLPVAGLMVTPPS